MSERSGIEIDYCPTCRGVWLDRGELDKIIERSLTPAAPAAPPPTHGQPQQYEQQQYAQPQYAAPPPEPQYAPAAPAAAQSDPDADLARLKQLGDLRAAGVLTEEEFQAQKARLLGL